jgi:predicted MFS family arabinose efflux permease
VALLSCARFFVSAGYACTLYVGILGSAVFALGADAYSVAFLMLAFNVASILGSSSGGVVVDRFGPRRTLAAACGVHAVLGVSYFLLPATLATLVVLACLYVLVYGVANTCLGALPVSVVEERDLARANACMNMAATAAYVAGPAAGGVATLARGTGSAFAIMAVASLGALAATFLLRTTVPASGSHEGKRSGSGSFFSGVSYAFSVPVVRTLVLLAFMSYLAFGAFDSLETIFYRDVLEVGADWTGWFNAAMGVGGFLGSSALLRLDEKHQNLRTVSLLTFGVGVGTVVYVGTANPWISLFGMFVLGMASGLFSPLLVLIAQRESAPGMLGRVTGVIYAGERLSGVLPLLAAPFLADAFGVQAVLVTSGCIVAAVGAVFFLASGRGASEMN